MRWMILVVLCAACDDTRMGTADAAVDLSVAQGNDLSAGADLSGVPDLKTGGDAAMACLESADGGLVAGDRCSNAVTLVAGTMRSGDSTSALNDDYHFGAAASAACSAEVGTLSYPAPDAAYTIVIPAGKTLTVTLQHSNLPSMWYPMVAIVTDCCAPAASCLAAKDVVIPNANPRVVSYTNAGAAPLTVFIIVDGSPKSSAGSYDIVANLS
jgi:hypothetical protein